MTEDQSEIEEIARNIRGYLSDHPDAADSLEGIVHWWLLRQQIRFTSEKVKQALDYLVSRDLIARSVTLEGKEVYTNIRKAPRLH